VLEAVFILLEFPSPSRRIFIGSHSLPPLWFVVSVLQLFVMKDGETVREMYDRLMLLVSNIKALGSDDWDDSKVTVAKSFNLEEPKSCNYEKKRPKLLQHDPQSTSW
jgi:hypothetical protein